MAEPDKPMDPIQMQVELKRIAREEKMKKKQAKREVKMKRKQEKRLKKQEKMRAKLAAKGIKLPERAEIKGKEKEPSKTLKTAVDDLPEAEIITAEADIWTPKSSRKMDEIQKRIDRMDHTSVKTLRERYKERYGEDMEIPDIYETKPSIELETAIEAGEMEPIEVSSSDSRSISKDESKPESIWGKAKARGKAKDKIIKKKAKVKVDRPLRLLDYRTPMYLRDKFGANSGKGKRIGLAIGDVILNIILTIFIIKIIATIVYVIKDRREAKFVESLQENSAQPQATS